MGGKSSKKGMKMIGFQKAGKHGMTTTTVMFVPSTKGGILLKILREAEERLSQLTGFKIKYTESGGTPLMNLFNVESGKGSHCGRDICPPCDEGEEGKRQNCRTRSILYETSCKLCNPEDNKKVVQPSGSKSKRVGVYVGETSRSLSERMGEHVQDARAFREGSHIVKHWMDHHPSSAEIPAFRYKIIRSFKDCLTRQVHEAIRIYTSEDCLLNGKSEYLNNTISRVTVDEDTYTKKKREFLEETAEKERLRKLEVFKLEKEMFINGFKRNHRAATQQNKEPKRIRTQDPSTTTDWGWLLEGGGENKVEEKNLFPIGVSLATENWPDPPYRTLAIEYFPEERTPICSKPSTSQQFEWDMADLSKDPTGMRCKKDPSVSRISFNSGFNKQSVRPRKPIKPDRSSNYILNLYGWSAWWERMTKIKSRPEEKTESQELKMATVERVRISEVKKHNFVSRYFTQRNLTRPEKREENPVENVQTINDRSTPKRNRDFERIQMGENSSPSKKFKFNNTMKIWKGREDACIALKKF